MTERATRRVVRIFVSSPADLRPERAIVRRVIKRLNREFGHHFAVEAILWEREPLRASASFKTEIAKPHQTDVVLVVLWSRLGVPLAAVDQPGPLSGRQVTGTEWEFEDALAGYKRTGQRPDLLLYRKTAEIDVRLTSDTEVLEKLHQKNLVEDFFRRWTLDAKGNAFIAASWSFNNGSEFEGLVEEHLRKLLEKQIHSDEAIGRVWHLPPYRGLESFEPEHDQIFFGRTRARHELRELLTRQIAKGVAFVLVTGASGSGKSSLVKAGLVPDLAEAGMIGRVGLVRRAVMRPSDAGADPLAALAAAIMSSSALPELAQLQYGAAELAALLHDAPAQAALPIRQGLSEAGKLIEPPLTDIAEKRLIVVVDQLEEIFTIDGLNERDRQAFIVALDALAKSEVVWVVATMRSDFFNRLENPQGLALGRLAVNDACYRLLPPNEVEISQIIRQPAVEAGLRFEQHATYGISLDEAIGQVAAKDSGALPLLSFLLDQLWRQRSTKGVLSFSAYRKLGELKGVVGKRAEDVFQRQPITVQKELVPLLRELVTIEGGTPVSRSVPMSRFPKGTARRALVEAFLDAGARLLVSDHGQVRLAHEALLSHWPRAKEQIERDARDIELRGRLEQEAKRWRIAPKREKRGRLVVGLPLAEARALLKRWSIDLPEDVREFVIASQHNARGRQRRFWALIAAAVLCSGPLLLSYSDINNRNQLAVSAERLMSEGNSKVAATYAIAANPGGSFLFDQAPDRGHSLKVNPWSLPVLLNVQTPWLGHPFSQDSKRLIAATAAKHRSINDGRGTIRGSRAGILYDTYDGSELQKFDDLSSFSFSQDSKSIIVKHGDRTFSLYSSDGHLIRKFSNVSDLQFVGASLLLSSDRQGQFSLRSSTGDVLRHIGGLEACGDSLRSREDDVIAIRTDYIAVCDRARGVGLLETGGQSFNLSWITISENVHALEFAPDGSRLLVRGERSWKLIDVANRLEIRNWGSDYEEREIASDSRTAIISIDQEFAIIDLETGDRRCADLTFYDYRYVGARNIVVLGGRNDEEGATIRIIDIDKCSEINRVSIDGKVSIGKLTYLPNPDRIVTPNVDRVYDLREYPSLNILSTLGPISHDVLGFQRNNFSSPRPLRIYTTVNSIYFAVRAADGRFAIYRKSDGALLVNLPRLNGITIADRLLFIVSEGDATGTLFDTSRLVQGGDEYIPAWREVACTKNRMFIPPFDRVSREAFGWYLGGMPWHPCDWKGLKSSLGWLQVVRQWAVKLGIREDYPEPSRNEIKDGADAR